MAMERITKKTVIIPDVITETDNHILIDEYLKDAECMGLTKVTQETERNDYVKFR